MTQETDTHESFDPMVDVFVGLACVVFLVILLVLPFAQTQAQRTKAVQEITQQVMASQDLTIAKTPTLKILAQRQSVLVVEAGGTRWFHLDDLIDNPDLDALLLAARNRHPLLFVDPSGQEAMFLLETVLARQGFSQVSRIYLDQHCGFLRHEAAGSGCTLP